MLSLETIRFANKHEALLAHVGQDTSAGEIIAVLKLPRPRALICLNGGTAELGETLKMQLRRLLVDGLACVAAENAIMLVTDGTDAGIFSLLGEGLAKWGRQAPCLGVTPSTPVTWPGRS
jgi:SLOG in TRPM, prokaryote